MKIQMCSETISGPGSPLGTVCSVMATGACVTITVLAAVGLDGRPIQMLLFAGGAAAFASNLTESLHPTVRTLAALVQGTCVFELFGFSVGVTVIAFAGRGGWDVSFWWTPAVAWGTLAACVGALVFATTMVWRALARARNAQ